MEILPGYGGTRKTAPQVEGCFCRSMSSRDRLLRSRVLRIPSVYSA